MFDLATCGWERHSVGKGPSRKGHACCLVDGHVIYVIGGRHAASPVQEASADKGDYELLPDVWTVDTVTMKGCSPRMFGDIPPRREGHCAVLAGSTIFVVGGVVGGVCVSDVLSIDTSRNLWGVPRISGAAPSARSHSSCITLSGGNILFFGGKDHWGNVHGDIHVLDAHNLSWSRPACHGPAPLPGWGGRMLTGKWEEIEKVFIWGLADGGEGGQRSGTGHMLTIREGGIKASSPSTTSQDAARVLDFQGRSKKAGLTQAEADTRGHIHR